MIIDSALCRPGDLFVRSVRTRPFPHNHYPFDLPAVQHLDGLAFTSRVAFLVGENGAGKSTLLEALAVACGFNAEGGSRNFTFSTAHTHSPLHDYVTVVRGVRRPRDGFFLRAESFYNLATDIDARDSESSFDAPIIDAYGGLSLHEQSHGESFFSLLLHRFRGNGLYLLDEPEAALSPVRQLSMLRLMRDLCRQGSQFIISSHSPMLMAFPHAQVFVIDEGGIRETPYEETEHYQITRRFLQSPEPMLRDLFADDPDER